ncbi:MAG: hypothetical protein H0X30_00830 [Anaerolineae bacterium]|nr:hypothetical protein [Anaerolineae bacterium]
MIIPEHIMQGVAALVLQEGREVFTRAEIRKHLSIEEGKWNASYNPTFQGMRLDQPGGAPNVNQRFRNVFRQVKHGEHTLTEYGKQLIQEFID